MGNGCCGGGGGKKAKASAGTHHGNQEEHSSIGSEDNSAEDNVSCHRADDGERLSRRFSDESALRQREVEINRLNPTDQVDQWKEKMLMDVGSDPLAVFRDFPRMKVSVTPSTVSSCPAAPPKPSSSATKNKTSPKAGESGSREHPHQRPNPLTVPVATHDASRMFQERNQRVLETVLKLAALCGEDQTFGAAFQRSWQHKEEENAAAYDAQKQQQQDGRTRTQHQSPLQQPSLTGVNSTGNNVSAPYDVAEVLDVHHLLQHACLESGMLVVVETYSTTSGATGQGADSANNRDSSQSFASANKRARNTTAVPNSSVTRRVDTSAPLLGNHSENHAPYGSTRTRHVASSSALSTPAVQYKVVSVTFHIMQFMVQGVMFFPMQRFKHLIWMPWASQYRDLDWEIRVRHDVISERSYQQLIQRRAKWEAAALASTFPAAPTELILQEPGTGGVGIAVGAGAATAAIATGGSLSHISTPRQMGGTPRHTSGMLGSNSISRRGSALPRGAGSPAGSDYVNDGPSDAASSPQRHIIHVEHVQTIRNYVEEDQRRATPALELQLACDIAIDLAVAVRHITAPATPAGVVSDSSVAFGSASGAAATTSGGAHGDSAFRRTSRQNSSYVSPPDYGSGTVAAGGGSSGSKIIEEVVEVPLSVHSALVEAPVKKLCTVSGEWKERRKEMAFLLATQFDADLAEVKVLPKASAYA